MNAGLLSMHNILLIFNSTNFPECVQFSSRQGSITVDQVDNRLILTSQIELPNTIQIDIKSIKDRQYLELVEFWLGGIKFDDQKLVSIAKTVDTLGNIRFATFWDSPAQIHIEIFDKNPISYHLHYGSKILLHS